VDWLLEEQDCLEVMNPDKTVLMKSDRKTKRQVKELSDGEHHCNVNQPDKVSVLLCVHVRVDKLFISVSSML